MNLRSAVSNKTIFLALTAALAAIAVQGAGHWGLSWAADLMPVATLAAGYWIWRPAAGEPATTQGPSAAASAPPHGAEVADLAAAREADKRLRIEATRLAAARCGSCLTRTAAQQSAEDLRAFRVFNEFAGDQLRSVIDTAGDAVDVIASRVSDADVRISKLLSFLRRSASEDDVGRAVLEIESQIDACRSTLAHFVASQREASDYSAAQRSKVAGETAEVMKSLEDVDRIARVTTMMSINVSIEAGRAGPAGKGFTVIAREIRELAASTQALAAEVGKRIGILQHAVTVAMEDDAKRREEIEASAFNAVSRTLDSFLGNVHAIVRHERKALHEVEQEEKFISDAIVTAMGRMQFHDVIRQQLEQIVGASAMIEDHLVDLAAVIAGTGESDGGESLLQKLTTRMRGYTMDSQRDSLRLAMGEPAVANGAPKIELF